MCAPAEYAAGLTIPNGDHFPASTGIGKLDGFPPKSPNSERNQISNSKNGIPFFSTGKPLKTVGIPVFFGGKCKKRGGKPWK